MTENDVNKYEKGSLGWLKKRAKKDGFDNLTDWNEWKRKRLPKINSVNTKRIDYIVIKNVVYNIDDLISGKGIKITNIIKDIGSIKQIPKDICGGVYVFWVKSGESYIGSTLQYIKARLNGHDRIVKKLISKINIYQTENDFQTSKLEDVMIDIMRPELNARMTTGMLRYIDNSYTFDDWKHSSLLHENIQIEKKMVQEVLPKEDVMSIQNVITTTITDICIEKEISDLINVYSIPVLFSTCGNDKGGYGYIVIQKSYEEMMEKLGYKRNGIVHCNDNIYNTFEPRNLCTGLCDEEVELDDEQKNIFLNERKIVGYIVSKNGEKTSLQNISKDFRIFLEEGGCELMPVDIFFTTKEDIERANIFVNEDCNETFVVKENFK